MREVLRCASNHVEILPHFWHRVPLRGLPSLTSRRRAPRYASGGAPRRGRTWMVPARRADGVQALDEHFYAISTRSAATARARRVLDQIARFFRASAAQRTPLAGRQGPHVVFSTGAAKGCLKAYSRARGQAQRASPPGWAGVKAPRFLGVRLWAALVAAVAAHTP